MKKYRFKDKEFNRKFFELFPDAEISQTECHNIKLEHKIDGFNSVCWLSPKIIEMYKTYDPNDWNNYPNVKPPEDVLMRIESKRGHKDVGYYREFEEGGQWCYQGGTIMPKAFSDDVVRYRPWE